LSKNCFGTKNGLTSLLMPCWIGNILSNNIYERDINMEIDDCGIFKSDVNDKEMKRQN
jgi:hypothetical protein